ncbi:MAG: amidohydrolase family protein [Gemmatimonadaceae bacterium]|nr:amidohydrolase family protein [Gemmatimonadaceae bacterium]
MKHTRYHAATALLALCAAPLPAQQLLAVRGATVHTATGAPIADATILVRDGRIAAVGRNVSVPAGALVIDATGKVIVPGFIDEHSHIGARPTDLNDRPMIIGPQHRIRDALDLEDPDWKDAVKGGVTSLTTGPGSGENVSGMAIVLKTFGSDLSKRILLEKGGMKFAMGPKRSDAYPATAMGVAANLRQYLIKTQEYVAAQKRWEDGGRQGAPPARDLGYDAMAEVLARKVRVRAHVHSATDVMTILRLKDEFGFDLTLHHSTEAYKVATEVAKRGVSAVVLPLGSRIGVTDDAMKGPFELWKAGVKIAMHTDHPVINQKWLRLSAGLAMRYGLPEDEALKAITINVAEIQGVADRVGSIAVGKDADFVVMNGPWYEPRTRVDLVVGDGAVIYDRSTEGK